LMTEALKLETSDRRDRHRLRLPGGGSPGVRRSIP
jgi:hypothetical protein